MYAIISDMTSLTDFLLYLNDIVSLATIKRNART